MLRLNSSGSEAYGLRERQHREDLCTMNRAKIFNHTVKAKKVKHHQSHTRRPVKLCLVLSVAQSDANHQNDGMSLSTSERLGRPLFKICAAFSEWEEGSKTWESDSEQVLSESRKNRGTGCHNVFYIVGQRNELSYLWRRCPSPSSELVERDAWSFTWLCCVFVFTVPDYRMVLFLSSSIMITESPHLMLIFCENFYFQQENKTTQLMGTRPDTRCQLSRLRVFFLVTVG